MSAETEKNRNGGQLVTPTPDRAKRQQEQPQMQQPMQQKTMQNRKVRKIPERQCLGCGAHKPKSELVRVVRTPDGGIVLDVTGKKSGRGAYICGRAACLAKARKTRRIENALGTAIPAEVWEALESALAEGSAAGTHDTQ